MITGSKFKPAWFLANRHLQTILPNYICRINESYINETFELSDGDFVDLAWTSKPIDENDKTPIIIVLHGLEASLNSPYIQQMMQAISERKWHGVLMHFRGCSGRPNRLARAYHSGDTNDIDEFHKSIMQRYPQAPRYAVGFSIGGNILLKYAGEKKNELGFETFVAICPPVKLDACANALGKGFSRYYQRRLLNLLKAKVLAKWSQFDYQELLGTSREKLLACRNFWTFDDAFTAPMHGFDGVFDYYRKSSSYPYILEITKPCLMIHAMDDPFMPGNLIDGQFDASKVVTTELSRHGGHLGFISGNIFKPEFWLAERICQHIQSYL